MSISADRVQTIKMTAGLFLSAATARYCCVSIPSMAFVPYLAAGQLAFSWLPTFVQQCVQDVVISCKGGRHMVETHADLSECPDFKERLYVTEVDLSHNRIKKIEGIEPLEGLRRLDLKGNQISYARNLSLHSALTHINFSRNRFILPPDTKSNSLLVEFIMAKNQLIEPPCVDHNLLLTELVLSDNDLYQAPDLSKNLKLLSLNLSGNKIQYSPDLSKNTKLGWLNLANNQLSQPPNLSNNPHIRQLDLANNKLIEAPDFSNKPNLTVVNLSGNLLKFLPDSIFSLHSYALVNLENNRFTQEYVTQFKARLATFRKENPGFGPRVNIDVYDGLSDDENEFGDFWEESLGTILSIDSRAHGQIATYLESLKATADFLDENDPGKKARNSLIERVENVLSLACIHQGFRDMIVSIIEDEASTCEDGVTLLFNDIEVQWELHRRDYSVREFATLSAYVQRYELVKRLAKLKAEEMGLGDVVEIVLYFQLRLKNELSLPISTHAMLYPDTVVAISDAMVRDVGSAISRLSQLDLLAQSEVWRTLLKREDPQSFQTVEDEAVDQINALSADMPTQSYLEQCDMIRAQREANLIRFARAATIRILRIR